MNIMWKYLDKRAAAISAIKDFGSMRFIINSTDDEIKKEFEKMTTVASPNFDGMPHAYNPKAGEERMLDGIDQIDILKERYRQAVEYMNWFRPAWRSFPMRKSTSWKRFTGARKATAAMPPGTSRTI